MNKEIYVTQSYLPPLELYIQEIQDMWESRMLTNIGEKHKKLQSELAKYLDVNDIELFKIGRAHV